MNARIVGAEIRRRDVFMPMWMGIPSGTETRWVLSWMVPGVKHRRTSLTEVNMQIETHIIDVRHESQIRRINARPIRRTPTFQAVVSGDTLQDMNVRMTRMEICCPMKTQTTRTTTRQILGQFSI